MAKKLGKRIYRAATDSEKKRHAKIRKQVESELPELRRLAKKKRGEIESQGVAIRHVVATLKAERERQGLSLADVKQRTGIDRSALSRLENNEDANPTLNTLARYADAVGKEMLVVLADARSN